DGPADGVYLDPARRSSGHSNTSRLTRPEDYTPSLDFAFGLGDRLPTGVKLGPGFDRELIPAGAEAQWVSVDGALVEMGLWFGALARPGVRRSALLLGRAGSHELSAAADSADAEAGALGAYIYEPDGAVIRARLIGDLARSLDARMLSEGIAYLTADAAHETPFATCFRVLEQLPNDEKKLKAALAARGIGTLEIKKRGIDIDPATLRTRLKLKGSASATIVLTRAAGKHVTLLVERV
ncbi:THUMP-like domain-containing protein, partial [Microterricola pindariensis]